MGIENVGESIARELQILPEGHPHKKSLESMLRRVRELERKDLIGEQEEHGKEADLIRAKKKLKGLVTAANDKNGQCCPDTLRRNEERKKELGKDYVTDFLPADFVLFNHIINPLRRAGLLEKRALINQSSEGLRVRGIGHVGLKIVMAVWDVAIAEARAQAPNNPQV